MIRCFVQFWLVVLVFVAFILDQLADASKAVTGKLAKWAVGTAYDFAYPNNRLYTEAVIAGHQRAAVMGVVDILSMIDEEWSLAWASDTAFDVFKIVREIPAKDRAVADLNRLCTAMMHDPSEGWRLVTKEELSKIKSIARTLEARYFRFSRQEAALKAA